MVPTVRGLHRRDEPALLPRVIEAKVNEDESALSEMKSEGDGQAP